MKIITKQMRQRADWRKVVVIGENDFKPERFEEAGKCKKGCPACAWCWPGKFGAVDLVNRLSRSRKAALVMPPDGTKDARQWTARNDFAAELTEACKKVGVKVYVEPTK